MDNYCNNCKHIVEINVVSNKKSFVIRGETIDVDANIPVCKECGNLLNNEELDSVLQEIANNEYRKKHRLLFPNEIRLIREQYGLSQRKFSKILNFGNKTICKYEGGIVQDKIHNSLLLFLKKPENMKMYLMDNEINIDEKSLTKLYSTIEKLEKKC